MNKMDHNVYEVATPDLYPLDCNGFQLIQNLGKLIVKLNLISHVFNYSSFNLMPTKHVPGSQGAGLYNSCP